MRKEIQARVNNSKIKLYFSRVNHNDELDEANTYKPDKLNQCQNCPNVTVNRYFCSQCHSDLNTSSIVEPLALCADFWRGC